MIDRRAFLRRGGLGLLGGLVAGSAWTGLFAGTPFRSLLVLSRRPENLETPIEWFDRLITPNDLFFVRSHFGVPARGRVRRLRLDGLVTRPLELGLGDLERLPQTTLTAVLQCSGNGRSLQVPGMPGVQWGHGAMGQAAWTGVRLGELLERAGVTPGAAHVGLLGADVPPAPSVPPFNRSIPLDRAMDPGTLVVLRMNGEPLSLAHGGPFRLVVPGWAGNHWVKWLTSITVQREEAKGFYYQTAYRLPRAPVAPGAVVPPEETVPVTTFPVRSVIARPQSGSRHPRGRQEVVGVAFSGEAPISKVEVSLDGGGAWHEARLEGKPGIGRWQVFGYRFEAQAGPARAAARAYDTRGNVQPSTAAWNPSGYFWNAWHSVEWEVV